MNTAKRNSTPNRHSSNNVRILEKTLVMLAALGLVTKELFMPDGSVLFILGMTVLGSLYLFFGWMVLRERESKTMKLSLAAPAGIVLAIACMGIMFKLQLWPGGDNCLLFALVTLITISAAAIHLRNKAKAEDPLLSKFYRNVLQRSIPFLVLAASLLFVSENTLIKFHYRNDPEFARLYILVRENPGNEQYQKALEDHVLEKYERVE